MEDKHLTLAEAARKVGVHPATLRHHAEKGNLKAELIGGYWITTEKALEDWRKNVHNPKMRRKQTES